MPLDSSWDFRKDVFSAAEVDKVMLLGQAEADFRDTGKCTRRAQVVCGSGKSQVDFKAVMTFGSGAKSVEVRSEKSVASAETELSSLRQRDHHLLTL